MRVLDKGHRYEVDHLDGSNKQQIQFVNREKGRECEGVTTQELLRVLIDRTWYCNDCLPWSGNGHIVDHLRMALMLHEARAMIRNVEKGTFQPEHCAVGADGHFVLTPNDKPASPYARMPDTGTETGSLNPGVCSHKSPNEEFMEGLQWKQDAINRIRSEVDHANKEIDKFAGLNPPKDVLKKAGAI